jgi:hypothetical protein
MSQKNWMSSLNPRFALITAEVSWLPGEAEDLFFKTFLNHSLRNPIKISYRKFCLPPNARINRVAINQIINQASRMKSTLLPLRLNELLDAVIAQNHSMPNNNILGAYSIINDNSGTMTGMI